MPVGLSNRRQFGWLMLSLLTVGCGASKTYPVKGRVTYSDGTPVTGGFIELQAQEGTRVNARGVIGADGTFVLGTHGDADGVPPGKYRALVRPLHARPGGKVTPGDPVPNVPIHPRYSSYETSGLEFTVAPTANDFAVVVEKP